MTLPEPIVATSQVTAALEKLSIRYAIGGSMASAIHGVVRSSQDSDIVAEMSAKHVKPFVQALQNDFYVEAEMIFDAIGRVASFNLIHRESMFKVDIFISKPRAFDQSQLSRARKVKLAEEPPLEAMVASAEDTLLAKLEWYRMGGEISDRQWRDVLGMLEVQQERLDSEYLRRWAKELGVHDLLDRAIRHVKSG
jgi:hypothetical protein